MRRERRKKKLIEPRLQLRFGMLFLGTAAVSALVQVLVLGHRLMEVAANLPRDSSVLQSQIPGAMGRSFVITFAMLAPVSMAIGVLLMFRVVGPVYRFRVFLTELIRGDNSGPCRIRKGDELHGLCDLLNMATAPLRGETGALSERQVDTAASELRPRRWRMRRARVLDRSLQSKFSLDFLSTAAAAVLLNVIVLLYTLNALAASLPNDGLALKLRIPEILPTTFLITIVMLFPLVVAIGFFATHRVVGPLYRFRVFLKGVIRGEQSAPCALRASDELHDFCDLLNVATAPLRAQERQGASQGERADAGGVGTEPGSHQGRSRVA